MCIAKRKHTEPMQRASWRRFTSGTVQSTCLVVAPYATTAMSATVTATSPSNAVKERKTRSRSITSASMTGATSSIPFSFAGRGDQRV